MTTEVETGLPETVNTDAEKQTVVEEVSKGTAPEVASEEVKQAEAEKTFTQAEVNSILQKRLQKEERRILRDIEQRQREQVEAQVREVAPKRDSFADDEAYLNAQVLHLAEKKAAELVALRDRASKQEKASEVFLERAEKASDRYPDFQLVVSNPTLPINEAMAEFIAESESGPDVAYFLGKNPIQASKISRMSPVMAARELMKIESELASKPKAAPRKAPEPITPVGSRGSASASSMPSDEDDIDTWMRKENARLRKR